MVLRISHLTLSLTYYSLLTSKYLGKVQLVIPDIRKKKKRYLQEIVIAGNLVSETAEVHKNIS